MATVPSSKMQRLCGRPRGHGGAHAVDGRGDEGGGVVACLAPAGEIRARTDVVCVAGGEIHRVDVDGQAVCAPSAAVSWRCEPGDVVSALARTTGHHLCRECFPSPAI
jgi:hypothetical protein